ncbi:hypothetical protein HJFPF1_05010 [Paramyrothecium foliicola]|nr:hypothetical protein HJFPF1_05010 [Paramyrothecium foliicola]
MGTLVSPPSTIVWIPYRRLRLLTSQPPCAVCKPFLCTDESAPATMAALIDPTVTGKYPVILGDGLLPDSDSTTIFTGIRYNHKPELSSSAAPGHARLKPSLPGSTNSFDLSFNDQGGNFAYAGTRTADGQQYVLYFDPAREAFVLDRIETTFSMNLTRTPNNSDPESLGRRHPHLDSDQKPKAPPPKASAPKEKSKPAQKPRAKSPTRGKEPKRKFEKEKKNTDAPLSFPKPTAAAPKQEKATPNPRASRFEEEEEESEEEYGGLLVEYPGAEVATKRADFSPAFPVVRRFDEFMDRRESEGDDADGESDGEVDMDFKLPSPMNNHVPPPQPQYQPEPEPMDEDEQEEDEEDDLEKDLENAFEDLANSNQGSPNDDESEISEED